MNNRNINVDILKGIGIFLMVFDHVGFGNFFHIFIQAFHMPLFFIVSGYLYKEKEIKANFKKSFKKIFFPYIIFALFQFILYAVLNYRSSDNVLKAFISIIFYPDKIFNYGYIGALWFLYCMFISKNVFNFFILKVKSEIKRIICAILIVLFIYFYKLYVDINLPFLLLQNMIAFIFLYMGYIFKKYSLLNVFRKNSLCKYIIVILFLLFTFVNTGANSVSVDMRSARIFNYFYYLISSLSGTLVFWNIIPLLKRIFSNKLIESLKYFSVNGISFLVFNQMIILFFQKIINFSFINSFSLKLIETILTLIIIYILNEVISKSKLKMIIGK